MPHVLVGYGPRRSNDPGRTEWNWAKPGEYLLADGLVCCSNPMCGCTLSFVGMTSRKRSTRGVVVAIPQETYVSARDQLNADSIARYKGRGASDTASVALAYERVTAFDELSAGLKDLPPGTIVRIAKRNNGEYDLLHSAQETAKMA